MSEVVRDDAGVVCVVVLMWLFLWRLLLWEELEMWAVWCCCWGELLWSWVASRDSILSVRVFKRRVVAGWMVGLLIAVSAEALADVARVKMSSSFSPTEAKVFVTSWRASSMSEAVPAWARFDDGVFGGCENFGEVDGDVVVVVVGVEGEGFVVEKVDFCVVGG